MKSWIIPAIVSGTAFLLGAQMCPREKEKQVEVPKIVTLHDTVDKTPKWLAESLKVWRKRKHTTDTVNLTLTETVIDTQYVPVNAPQEERPDLWPVLYLHGGRVVGDPIIIGSFNTRTGKGGISQVFPTGYITALDVDSNMTPRMTFTKFPPEEKHGFWHNPKVFGIGFGTGALVCALFCR